MCFQPKVELATGIVRGAEALVRWNHPRLGRVRPDEFIAIAEHTGDIRTLTMIVMRKALAECRGWRDLGLDLSVAVNLSARNLLDLHLVDDVAAAIDEAGVPAATLTLELTESMVMSESQRSVDVLSGLPSWASACRATTSAPATRRSPTCAGCRSARSRSTSRSSPAWPSTRATGPSPARCWPSAATWGS